MKQYIVYAIIAGVAWGIGGYFEKAGLRAMGIPPIAGITLRTASLFSFLDLYRFPPGNPLSIHPTPKRGS